MKVFIGSDHRGFKLKEALKRHLTRLGHTVSDKGPFSYDPNDDYPDFVIPAARAVARDKRARGIVLGATGQGEAMAANRVKGVRAAVYYGGPRKILTMSRGHNNANILSLGASFLTEGEAKSAVEYWIAAPFEGGRHIRRLKKFSHT